MSKRTYQWLGFGLFVLLIAFSVAKALWARKAQQEAVAQASVTKVQTVVELAESDVIKA
jgi:heme exporter protein D